MGFVRFLQIPQLLFTGAQLSTRETHPNDPSEHRDGAKGHTGDPAAIETNKRAAFVIPRRDHGACDDSASSG